MHFEKKVFLSLSVVKIAQNNTNYLLRHGDYAGEILTMHIDMNYEMLTIDYCDNECLGNVATNGSVLILPLCLKCVL